MTRPHPFVAAAAIAVAMAASACSPTFDWREFSVQGTELGVAFPCRPDRHVRDVRLGERRLSMQMLVCAAGGSTFAVSFVDVPDPAALAAVMTDLRAAAIGNVRGQRPTTVPFQLKGMQASAQAVRVSVEGRLPDGAKVAEHAVWFARGLRVYQATVIGAAPGAAEVEAFLAGLKFPA